MPRLISFGKAVPVGVLSERQRSTMGVFRKQCRLGLLKPNGAIRRSVDVQSRLSKETSVDAQASSPFTALICRTVVLISIGGKGEGGGSGDGGGEGGSPETG
ncbi:hypothetical protein V1478_002486 [Vespula squamosa]|uniref:Uncharacterized protein n=1 Tax=Vespula squamosa TaxID=30214 RepID=A0ABD2BSP2_VESSQ